MNAEDKADRRASWIIGALFVVLVAVSWFSAWVDGELIARLTRAFELLLGVAVGFMLRGQRQQGSAPAG